MNDYISREAAKEFFLNMDAGNGHGYSTLLQPEEFAEYFDEFPTANVEPVRYGRWEECDWVDVDEHGFGTRRTFKAGLRCSQCACVFKKELLWKRTYCPSCGAKMELEGENHDN